MRTAATRLRGRSREAAWARNSASSAGMNIWLHRKVMEGLAANGGRVPAAMAD